MESNPEEQPESHQKRKRIIKVLSLYAVTGWLLTQIITTIAPYFDLPSWSVKAVIIIVVSGFPVAALYAWFFDEGISKVKSFLILCLCGLGAVGISTIVFKSIPSASVTQALEVEPKTDKTSIAVLPFLDLSQNKDSEYFSDGLSEELLNILSNIEQLKVISRTSSFSFKGKNEDARTIGKKLNVSHLLEGSVRKSGNKLRITAQLIKTEDGTHLWSETFDRDLDDIFKIQDEISAAVVSHLKVTVLKPEGNNPSSQVYNLYLEGKYFTNKRDKESAAHAVQKYKQALSIDSTYAPAWTWLAVTYTYQVTNGYIPGDKGRALTSDAALRAIRYDPQLAEAHATLSRIYSVFDWDWAKADASIKKAIELGPGNALALTNAGILAMHLGRFEEAISLYKRAIEVDPLRTASFYGLGLAYYYAGNWSEAKSIYRKLLELNPTFASANYQLARTQLLEGKYDSALLSIKSESDESWRLDGLPLVYFKLNRLKESDAALKEVVDKYAEDSAYQIAEIYAYRGEIDLAFQWLERAYQQRDGGLANVRVEPMLKNLHTSEKWIPFLKKMKLI